MSEVTRTLVEREKLDDWETLHEVHHAPFYTPLRLDDPGEPIVVVRRHRGTAEVRVDVYGCNEGLPVTFTNGGTGDPRAKWFRDVLCRRG